MERKHIARTTQQTKPQPGKRTRAEAEAEFNALLDALNSTHKTVVTHKPLLSRRAVTLHTPVDAQQTHTATTTQHTLSKEEARAIRRRGYSDTAAARAQQLASETNQTIVKEPSKCGGRRAGAGRKLGSVSKKTAELVAQILAQGLTPLEYLLNNMRDVNNSLAFRAEMAKIAAPFIHPRLASTVLMGGDGKPLIPAAVGIVPLDAAQAVDYYKKVLGG